jgi:hypothetical protein
VSEPAGGVALNTQPGLYVSSICLLLGNMATLNVVCCVAAWQKQQHGLDVSEAAGGVAWI